MQPLFPPQPQFAKIVQTAGTAVPGTVGLTIGQHYYRFKQQNQGK